MVAALAVQRPRFESRRGRCLFGALTPSADIGEAWLRQRDITPPKGGSLLPSATASLMPQQRRGRWLFEAIGLQILIEILYRSLFYCSR